VRQRHLVQEDDSVVARAFGQAGAEQEALHLARGHELHARVRLQHARQQVPGLRVAQKHR